MNISQLNRDRTICTIRSGQGLWNWLGIKESLPVDSINTTALALEVNGGCGNFNLGKTHRLFCYIARKVDTRVDTAMLRERREKKTNKESCFVIPAVRHVIAEGTERLGVFWDDAINANSAESFTGFSSNEVFST